jgi:preprotein translocase subunit SecB
MTESSNGFKSALKFSNYAVNEIHFNLNSAYTKNESNQVPISFDMDKSITYDEAENSALLTLNVRIFENAKGNNYPFQFNVITTGYFQVANIHDQKERNLVETNAIAILFPYIRALITSFTANANIPPLILPPINVVKFMQDKDIALNKQ